MNLYLSHFPQKSTMYAKILSKDPDLARIPVQKCITVYSLCALAMMNDSESQFKNIKDLLKKCLVLGNSISSSQISSILHNLAIINMAEIDWYIK